MLQSPGLRLAFAGFVLLIAGAGVLFLSNAAGVAMMLVGGMAVFSGFVWTLLQYYVGPQEPPE
ncbi:MAG TPA: hypothetical protein VJB57_13000 [Dehalococcoidia bacterium]|nr:hypothetical protein [Dehalococcoidia bacterium]